MDIRALGYLVVDAVSLEAWRTYATDVLGFAVAASSDDELRLKMDERPYRIVVRSADTDGLAAAGWELAGRSALDVAVAELEAAGVDVCRASTEEASARRVRELVRVADPAGSTLELFHSPVQDHSVFVSPTGVSSFVTGTMGMGHIVMLTPCFEESLRFYTDLLGFRVTDWMVLNGMDLCFLHCNTRHHSLALANAAQSGLAHFMVEAGTIDDVGYALDRFLDAGVRIKQGLGRHSNDQMLSFYAATPARFDVEFGWGGLHVDDATLDVAGDHEDERVGASSTAECEPTLTIGHGGARMTGMIVTDTGPVNASTGDTLADDARELRLRDRARELRPTLAARAEKTEELRRIPDETMEALHGAGLFRALQPARFGGSEADPVDFFEAVVEIGAVCGSTAWVTGVVGVHNWQLALFELEAQHDVWGDDTQVLIASSYAPTGKVEPVSGGFRLSGRWHFSSGCDHARWVFLGGVVPRAEGATGPPDMRTFLVPSTDYRIDDNWFVAGLSGSGSKDIVVDDAFVPEYRTHRFQDVLALDSPGNAVNPAPLFRMPFGGIFCNAVCTPALGAANGALAEFTESIRTRVMVDRTRAVEDPFIQLRIAEATASLDGAHLQLVANLSEMMSLAQRGEQPTLERRARYRWDASRTTRLATEAVDSVFEASGGRAIHHSNPLQRAFRDVHAMRGHANNNPDKTAQIFARAALGFPNKEFLL